jgi:hypothetical protein
MSAQAEPEARAETYEDRHERMAVACRCEHTAFWHSHDGKGACEYGADCRCERFEAQR